MPDNTPCINYRWDKEQDMSREKGNFCQLFNIEEGLYHRQPKLTPRESEEFYCL